MPEGVTVEEHEGRKIYRLVIKGDSVEQSSSPLTPQIDYRSEVLVILRDDCVHASRMGKIIAEKYGIEKDKAKLGVKETLKELSNEGVVDSVPWDEDAEPKKTRTIRYYLKGEGNETSLHSYLVRELVKLSEMRSRGAWYHLSRKLKETKNMPKP